MMTMSIEANPRYCFIPQTSPSLEAVEKVTSDFVAGCSFSLRRTEVRLSKKLCRAAHL
jgi:hypothetical protein